MTTTTPTTSRNGFPTVVPGTRLLGEVISWTCPAVTVKHLAVIEALRDSALDESVARELAPRHAFSRACKKLAHERIIRQVSESESTITFQFTKESREGDRFQYELETPDDGALRVRRFTEKPDAARAGEFVTAGNYFWNSGIFLWNARTLVNALREHLPKTAGLLEEIADAFGTRRFAATFRKLYPKCENISVDYAILEPRSAKGEQAGNIFCLPADFGWNDLGSWTALHEHHSAKSKPPNGNLISSAGACVVNAAGNYIHAPGKFVAVVGVSDLIVVETDDALLITTRQHTQDVGKVVKYLDEKKLHRLT